MRDAGIEMRRWIQVLGFSPDSRPMVDAGELDRDDDDADFDREVTRLLS